MATDHQAQIDALAGRVQAVTQKFQSEIDALKAQPGAENLDFSGLDAAVATEEAQADADAAAVAAPVDTSTAPAPAEGSVADGPAPDSPVAS